MKRKEEIDELRAFISATEKLLAHLKKELVASEKEIEEFAFSLERDDLLRANYEARTGHEVDNPEWAWVVVHTENEAVDKIYVPPKGTHSQICCDIEGTTTTHWPVLGYGSDEESAWRCAVSTQRWQSKMRDRLRGLKTL